MRQHGVYLRQRHIVVFLLDVAEHTVVPDIAIFGIVAQSLVIVLDGTGEVVLSDAAETTQLVDPYYEWITAECFVAVRFRTHIVVQIKLGHAPVEPRFVEVGLG